MARGELSPLGQRVALVLAQLGPEEVEHPDRPARCDLPAQHGLDELLEVVVVDLADRLETERARRHVGQLPEHFSQPP